MKISSKSVSVKKFLNQPSKLSSLKYAKRHSNLHFSLENPAPKWQNWTEAHDWVLLLLLSNVMEHRSLLVVCLFLLLPNLREVPHGTKGTGPEFITRPVYLRSQLRNNTNTVSTLVLLTHLLHVLCTQYAGIAHHRLLQTSGWGWADSKAVHGMECSGARSLYWRSLSAGAAAWSVPYCQYREVCSSTQPNAKQANELSTKNRPQVLCPGGIYSWWHSASSANGSRSHDGAPVTWAYGILCPAMVSPNAS